MSLQTFVVLVVHVFVLDPTHTAHHVLQVHVPFELVLIEEGDLAEGAVRVQEDDVSSVIDVPALHVLI